MTIEREYCTECRRTLTDEPIMLELDQRNNTYHDFGDVPEDQSQGWFPFGKDCAKKLRRQARTLRKP